MIEKCDRCDTKHNRDNWEKESFVVEAFGLKYHFINEIYQVMYRNKCADHLENFQPL